MSSCRKKGIKTEREREEMREVERALTSTFARRI
uniref:Uncharacterized protein n=1 Tax=Triticum urartu TaxID=4572 RepID=A0A8R7V4J4_TRIUA